MSWPAADFEETRITDEERTERFLAALAEALSGYGVVTTACYESPIREMVMRLLDAQFCKALAGDD